MNGIIILDKPAGITSHDAVLFMRRRFGVKKVGHAGTLDPMATGVLVLLLGSSTKLSSDFMADDKEYECELTLGAETDTFDREGKVISNKGIDGLTGEKVADAVRSFRGTIEQLPPMFSAVKHKGRKLYELARKGVKVERRPRPVVIKDIEMTKIDLPAVSLHVKCSKGTYIRTLAHDIGRRLSCGAYLTALRRTRSGRFSIEDAVTLDRLKGTSRESLPLYQ